MSKKNLVGELLVANPLNPKEGLAHSVILVVSHTNNGSLGLQLNCPIKTMPLNTVFAQIGLRYNGNDFVHQGGPTNPGKIHMVHSLDWRGLTTIEIAPNIGMTNDISVLTALTNNEGPEHFRACAGVLPWMDTVLEDQLNSRSKTEYKWEIAPANLSTVFEYDELDQWHKCVEASAREQVNRWFNLFQG
jgi:putative transcriptional regulator